MRCNFSCLFNVSCKIQYTHTRKLNQVNIPLHLIVALLLMPPLSPTDCICSILRLTAYLVGCCIRFPSPSATTIAKICCFLTHYSPPISIPNSRLIVALIMLFTPPHKLNRTLIDCCVICVVCGASLDLSLRSEVITNRSQRHRRRNL